MLFLKMRFKILIFVLILTTYLPLAQEENECLEIGQSQSIPSDIIDIASNIIVGYRRTRTFEPVIILNSAISSNSSHPIVLQSSEDDLVNRYTVVELSPDHKKILQIFSNETNLLTLRVSSVLHGNVVSTDTEGIVDGGYAPKWLNSQSILVSTSSIDNHEYDFTILSVDDTQLETLSFDLTTQPVPIEAPQLSPDLSHLAYWGRESTSRIIYVYSNRTLVSTPIFSSATYAIGLQWSPQGNYVSFFSDFNSSSLPQSATIVSIEDEFVMTTELSYSDPVVFPRQTEIIWSPDERYIAYQNKTSNFRGEIGSRTSVVDIVSQEVVDICIPGTLFWAPNGQYAAMFLRTSPSSSPPNEVLGLFVINIVSREIYEIPIDKMDDISLEVGWFDLTPNN